MKALRPGSHRAAIVLLLGLLALAFAVEGSQATHYHGDGRLALYNANCPLAELSAVHTAGWAPDLLAITPPEPVVLPIAVTSSGWVPRPVLSLTDSRAPPLA
jgi:hypothetical protein